MDSFSDNGVNFEQTATDNPFGCRPKHLHVIENNAKNNKG